MAANVKAAYYQAQAQEEFLNGLKKISSVNSLSSELARRQYEAGNISDLELLTQEAGSTQTQGDVKRAQGEVLSARAKLNRLMGLSDSEGNWTLAGSLPSLPHSDPSRSETMALALAQRQDLAAAHLHIAAVSDALSIKRGTRLIPVLNVGVDTERENGGSHITGPTLEMELPVFNWGTAKIKKLEAELRQAQSEAEALEADVRNDVEMAHAALRSAREVYSFQAGTLVPQREKILQETLLHYNAMQKSPAELLMAKSEEQKAQKERIEALRDYWIAHTELERAAGGSLMRRRAPQTPQPKSKP
jgi:cobalt-zinc-cadmium efflux system outer membrane protein